MSAESPTPPGIDGAAGDAVVRKAAVRLIPFLALLYFVSFLDRVNIGFAALTMNKDLGLSPEAFGLGAGIFFVGYLLFTVPGNALLRRFGASRWMATIMVVWGAISVMMAFVTTAPEFYVLRFALGAAESGFLPGVMLYLTYWVPEAVRGASSATSSPRCRSPTWWGRRCPHGCSDTACSGCAAGRRCS